MVPGKRLLPLLLALLAFSLTAPADEGFTEPKSAVRYRLIPAGVFMMGCVPGDGSCNDDEKPRHMVRIERPFLLAETETTNDQYRRCVTAGACVPPADPTRFYDAAMTPDGQRLPSRRNHPVVDVTWEQAEGFCRWSGARLPTEVEWEYASRGGEDGSIYPWGNELSREFANYGKPICCGGLAGGQDRFAQTAPVASFRPNGFGLFDMAGNVWEWVDEWYSRYPTREPDSMNAKSQRVLRGGSWYVPGEWLRASDRGGSLPWISAIDYGFRCARDVER